MCSKALQLLRVMEWRFDPCVQLKAAISAAHPSLPPENSGSKWPKTSLGAVKDGKRLTPDQLKLLNTICAEESIIFSNNRSNMDQDILVDRLAVILYECRCLERRLLCHSVALDQEVDLAAATPEEQERVAGVIAEANSADYWFAASKDGNRESHYLGPALGATLAHDLSCFQQTPAAMMHPLPGIVRHFRARVEALLPGMYTWFSDSSLHITVRALIG